MFERVWWLVPLVAVSALAAPPPQLQLSADDPSGPTVRFSVLQPDAGETRKVNAGGTPGTITGIFISGDDAGVFSSMGLTPVVLNGSGSTQFDVRFEPRGLVGSFEARFVVDFDEARGAQRHSIPLCASSVEGADGGMLTAACTPAPVPVTAMPPQGCSTAPTIGAAALVLLMMRAVSASRARARSDRSRR